MLVVTGALPVIGQLCVRPERPMRILMLILVATLMAASGCSEKPTLRIDQVRSAQFAYKPVSSGVLEELVAAFQRARPLRSDVGTTHPVRIDVVLNSGDTMVIFGGGGTGFQTVAFRNRQFNIQGEELEALLDRLYASYMAEQNRWRRTAAPRFRSTPGGSSGAPLTPHRLTRRQSLTSVVRHEVRVELRVRLF